MAFTLQLQETLHSLWEEGWGEDWKSLWAPVSRLGLLVPAAAHQRDQDPDGSR